MLASTVQFSKYGRVPTIGTTAYPHHEPHRDPHHGPFGATASRTKQEGHPPPGGACSLRTQQCAETPHPASHPLSTPPPAREEVVLTGDRTTRHAQMSAFHPLSNHPGTLTQGWLWTTTHPAEHEDQRKLPDAP
jgi:hypothetical protein